MFNKKSFTVIEVIVCLIIVLAVSAFLASAIGGAREYARRVQCVNNLRQIGMAINLYADDNNQRLPGKEPLGAVIGIKWQPALEPYIDDLDTFRCPSYKYHRYGNGLRSSYGYNYLGLTETTTIEVSGHAGPMMVEGIYLGKVRSATECIIVTDSGQQSNPTYSSNYINKGLQLDPRHSGGINILFVDGHVKWMRLSDIPVSTTWWNY